MQGLGLDFRLRKGCKGSLGPRIPPQLLRTQNNWLPRGRDSRKGKTRAGSLLPAVATDEQGFLGAD